MLEAFRTPRSEGLIAAFVFGDQGLQVQVVGPPDAARPITREEIGRMISSIRQEAARDDRDQRGAARAPPARDRGLRAGARAFTSSSRTTPASGSTSGSSPRASGTSSPRCEATRGAFNEAYATALVTSGLFAPRSCGSCAGPTAGSARRPSLALAAFVGGGVAAPFAIAIVGNGAIMSIYTKVFGQAWATDWQAGLTAPFVEETSKGAIFLLLLGLAPVVIRTASDGLIVGAYVGLGFQILEDIFYAQNSAFAQFGAHQSEAVLRTFVLRAVTGIPSHALYTALFGAGADLRARHAGAAAAARARASR